MIDLFLVATGGFLGAISRSIISKKLNNKIPFKHLGTLVVNISGALLLGFLVSIYLNTNVNLLIGIGFLGSFTTFSTFKVESIALIQSKQKQQFLVYFFLTYIIGISFAYVGFWLAQFIN